MAEDSWVDIRHPETGMTSTVHGSSVPAWETAGWTRADNGSEEPVQQQQLPQLPDSLSQTPGPAAPSDADEE